MNYRDFQRIEQEIENAFDPDDRNREKISMDAVIDNLNGMPSSGNVSYLLGYAYYLYPEKSDSQMATAIEHFESVLESNASEVTINFAMFYLGYCYFDGQDFAKSFYCFRQVDPTNLNDFYELKLYEVLFVSCASATGLAPALPYLERFVELALAQKDDDPFPKSLWNAFRSGTFWNEEEIVTDEETQRKYELLKVRIDDIFPWMQIFIRKHENVWDVDR